MVCCVIPANAATPIYADQILWHGRIDVGQTKSAQAIAIRRGVIVAVGSDANIIRWRGTRTKMVDLQNHWLLPGFNDAHVHLLDGGLELERVDLHDARSIEDLKVRLAAEAKRSGKNGWIQGSGWDETLFQQKRWPTRQDLDEVVADRPVVLERTDGHAAVVNTMALQKLQIDSQSVDPPGGRIEKDSQGEPTGVLKDAAMNRLAEVIPPLDKTGRRSALLAAMHFAASLGVTSVQDMSSGHIESDAATARLLHELDMQNQMPIRVYMAIALHSLGDKDRTTAEQVIHLKATSMLHMGGFKAFADGSAGSRTAFFHDGYTDQPSEHGLLGEDLKDLNEFNSWLLRAKELRAQVCTHAIGDAAVDTVLDAYSRVITGKQDMRFRIEHAQHLTSAAIKRMAELKVIASMQPYQGIDDGRWIGVRVGAQRLQLSYPWRSLQNAGVRLAFGTDWPVVPLDPWAGIYAATVRLPLDGRVPDGWVMDERLTLRQALDAYTRGSAVAEFEEQHKGRIQVGQWADVVEWDQDPFNRPLEALRENRALNTWVGGRLVYTQRP
jgi:predicted amidohydrolase YtcJ